MTDHVIAPSIFIASEKDIPALNILVNNTYRGEGSKKGWTTEADLLDGVRTDEASLLGLIKDANSVILKYIKDDQLQGCVYLKKKDTKLYLGMLAVSPGLQAKGIGKQLLAASEIYAAKAGCSSITMTVISVRHELIAWYIRHGYQLTGGTEPFPSDPKAGLPRQPLEFIAMEKKL